MKRELGEDPLFVAVHSLHDASSGQKVGRFVMQQNGSAVQPQAIVSQDGGMKSYSFQNGKVKTQFINRDELARVSNDGNKRRVKRCLACWGDGLMGLGSTIGCTLASGPGGIACAVVFSGAAGASIVSRH